MILQKNQLKAGVLLSYVVVALNNIIGLVYTPFMLRMMGQAEYGLYSLVASVVSYLTVLDLGFGNAIIRYTAKFRAEGKIKEQYEMFGMFFILYCFIGLIAFILGIIFSYNSNYFFDQAMTDTEIEKVRIMMILMSFNIAFTFPMSIWGAIINAYENFIFQKLVNIGRIILNPIVMIIMLLCGYKAIGMVVVTTIFNILTLSINCWYCLNKLHIKIKFAKFKWGFLKEVSIYSFWIFLTAIMNRIYWNTGQFVLGIYKGSVAISIYALAIQLHYLYDSFSTAITGVFLPKVTAMVVKETDTKSISNLFIRTGRIQYLIMAYILSGFIIFGESFICLWAGNEYKEAYILSLIIFIPITVPLIQNLGIIILQARNLMKFRSIVYIIISFISLLLSFYLAEQYGSMGCAIATSLALIAGQIIVMNIYYYKKIQIDIPTFWKEIIKMSIFPSILAILFLYLIQHITINTWSNLCFGIIVYTIFYIPLIWKTTMNDSERNLFIKPLKTIYLRFLQK